MLNLIGTVKSRKPQEEKHNEGEDEEEEKLDPPSQYQRLEELQAEDDWNAVIDDCKVGSLAVVHSLFVNGYGICVMKVFFYFPFVTWSMPKKCLSVLQQHFGTP